MWLVTGLGEGGFWYFIRWVFILFGRFLGCCSSSAVLQVFIVRVSFWGL